MAIRLLLSLLLAAQAGIPSGTISGRVALPDGIRASKPIQIVVFPGEYAEIYSTEVQRRADSYWEDYREAFIRDKEAFLLFRERAKSAALEYTLNRMRRDEPMKSPGYVVTSSNANHTFEFHGLPPGECKVLARITTGSQDLVWSESVIVTGSASLVVVLKPAGP